MSKDTVRMALGLPLWPRPERKATTAAAGNFTLTREQVAAAFAAQRAVWDERGYHTFAYWREQTEGTAALGDALIDLLDRINPVLFRELYDGAGEGK